MNLKSNLKKKSFSINELFLIASGKKKLHFLSNKKNNYFLSFQEFSLYKEMEKKNHIASLHQLLICAYRNKIKNKGYQINQTFKSNYFIVKIDNLMFNDLESPEIQQFINSLLNTIITKNELFVYYSNKICRLIIFFKVSQKKIKHQIYNLIYKTKLIFKSYSIFLSNLNQNHFLDLIYIYKIKNRCNYVYSILKTSSNELYIGKDLSHFNYLDNFYPWQTFIYFKMFDKNKNFIYDENRKIISIVDLIGKSGKSSFVKYLYYTFSDKIIKLTYGLSSQLRAAVINAGVKQAYIFDLPRTKGTNDKIIDLISIIEEIKNGFISSSMYGKHTSLIMNPPFVLVFSNFYLPYNNLSADRWECYDLISKNKTLKKLSQKEFLKKTLYS